MSHHRQLAPLRDRLSPEQLQARAAKTEVRAQISLEHAKTRGLVNLALNNTQALHRILTRTIWTGAVALLVLVILVGVVVLLWFRA